MECTDARYISRSLYTPDSFFYCDPPYINSDCGHYDAYTEQDYENLLKLLSTISGKFLLSSYPSTLLNEYMRGNNWYSWSIEQTVSVNARAGKIGRASGRERVCQYV